MDLSPTSQPTAIPLLNSSFRITSMDLSPTSQPHSATSISANKALLLTLAIVIPACCLLFGVTISVYIDQTYRRRLEHLIYNRTEFLIDLHTELTGRQLTVPQPQLPCFSVHVPVPSPVYLPQPPPPSDAPDLPTTPSDTTTGTKLFLIWLLAWILGIAFLIAYIHVIAFCVYMTLPETNCIQRPSLDLCSFDLTDIPTEDPLDQWNFWTTHSWTRGYSLCFTGCPWWLPGLFPVNCFLYYSVCDICCFWNVPWCCYYCYSYWAFAHAMSCALYETFMCAIIIFVFTLFYFRLLPVCFSLFLTALVLICR